MDEKIMDQEIGRRVEALRIKYGYSREVTAERLDVSLQHVNNMIKGRRRFTFPMLKKIQTVFHVPLEYLIYGETEKTDNSTILAILNGMDKSLYPHFEDILIAVVKTLNVDRDIRK